MQQQRRALGAINDWPPSGYIRNASWSLRAYYSDPNVASIKLQNARWEKNERYGKKNEQEKKKKEWEKERLQPLHVYSPWALFSLSRLASAKGKSQIELKAAASGGNRTANALVASCPEEEEEEDEKEKKKNKKDKSDDVI